MNTEYTDTIQYTSKKEQWKREKVASTIIDFESAKEAMSQRQFAKYNGVSRTTLQHWLSRKESLDAALELIEFLERPVGIAFLHRIIMAAHFEFCKKGAASIHNVSNFLKKSGLEPFVGTSYSTQRNVANNMDKSIVTFGEYEQKRLAAKMPEKWITLCEDETFHPAICMVAIEAVSNFIILEEYVEKRDAHTWNRVVRKALDELVVKVIQVTSDEARGLINHTEKGLGAHHSPDVFHVQNEIGKGTSGALSGTVKKAEKQVEEAVKQTQKEIKTKEQYENQPKRPRGRRPHFEKKIAEASEHERQAEVALDTARQNQETVKQAKQEIGKCYECNQNYAHSLCCIFNELK
jgi:DNA-binding transcriptional regulator YiaG